MQGVQEVRARDKEYKLPYAMMGRFVTLDLDSGSIPALRALMALRWQVGSRSGCLRCLARGGNRHKPPRQTIRVESASQH